MKKFMVLVLLFAFFQNYKCSLKSADSTEVYIIDSYITSESPKRFCLSFSTTDPCLSRLTVSSRSYSISDSLRTEHGISIRLDSLGVNKGFDYSIRLLDSEGKFSGDFNYSVPDYGTDSSSVTSGAPGNFYLSCCMGSALFALPYAGYYHQPDGAGFAILKPLPLLVLKSNMLGSSVYFASLYYSHHFKDGSLAPSDYYGAGAGTRQDCPLIDFLMPELSYVLNFKGYGGIMASVTAGLFRMTEGFTFCARYSYSASVSGGKNFHEISAGIFSNFFSLNL